MLPANVREMQQAIRGECLDGWLFCNFHHRDRLADEILGVDPLSVNSRLWLYAVPAEGGALRIVHAIEGESLAGLPGSRVSYSGRAELCAQLAPLAGKRWGCHFSPHITAISYLDAGTAALLREAGLDLVPASGLVQRFKGLLSADGMAAHESAARHLREIVDVCWTHIKTAFASGAAVYEGDIQRLMLDTFAARNLICDHPPIAAAGKNSANPHYEISHNAGGGALIAPDDVIQFDLWAKDAGADSVYADISWVGVYAKTAPAGLEAAFENLVKAREGALRFIEEELAAGRRPTGADIDRRTREILAGAGYAGAIRHRTGHGIDSEVHGSGVNIDSVEFPDERRLLDGSCFSLEPGIYFADFGLRTEINVYIRDGRPVISGTDRQFELLHC